MVGTQGLAVEPATEKTYIQLPINKLSSKPFLFYVVTHIIADQPFTHQKPIRKFESLQLADSAYHQSSAIDAIFGIDIWIKIILPQIIYDADAIAQSSKLGYIVFRHPEHPLGNTILSTNVSNGEPTNAEILQWIQRFWAIEAMPVAAGVSEQDAACEQAFLDHHYRTKTGRYGVSMPFNAKIGQLGRSKQAAIRQLFSMERRMEKNQRLAIDYRRYMDEFEANGYMERIHETEESGYYTPHHGVYGANKNKIRVVLNASCKTTTGLSLNECQMTGAKIQEDLALILVRFRTHQIGISADIAAMYCQIEMSEDHRKYQKIVWRESPELPISVYQLTRVAFGQTAAPFLAIRSLNQCATDYEHEFPIAAAEVRRSFYVDDLLTGAATDEMAINKASELTELLKKGEFPLAKWGSNSEKVNIAINGTAQTIDIKDPEQKTVLGLVWIGKTDQLAFRIQPPTHHAIWTKRRIVSEIGKLYDPNGLVAPVVIIAKILIQRLWRSKTDWDEKVTATLEQEWLSFQHQIQAVKGIHIPRWLSTTPGEYMELHGFSDASMDAYGCCVYIRTVKGSKINSMLVQSKTKVAPLKTQSIPRLELCGALLLSQLVSVINEHINLEISQTSCWTDSEIVLQWLNKASADLKVFVGNRVAKIQETTTQMSINWRWVPTKDNPADLASRGMEAETLAKTKVWWEGPEWLKQTPDTWPTTHIKTNAATLIEMRPAILSTTIHRTIKLTRSIKQNNGTTSTHHLIQCYSSYLTLLHVAAYIIKAIDRMRKIPCTHTFTEHQLERARMLLIRLDQAQTYGAELRVATQPGHNITPHDATMWYDKTNQILRLNGRIQSENLSYDQKYPAMLSPNGTLSKLILHKIHKENHGGPQLMIQLYRQHYWTKKIRQLAQTIVHRCAACRLHHVQTCKQLMAPLPTNRTTPQHPFAESGVDFMGPVDILTRRGRNPQIIRGYVCVFVCFVTRAIHLELVSDGTKDSFVAALRRFIATRGHVSRLWSDNGTTFIGADNYLTGIAQNHHEWSPTIQHDLHFEWRFIVPRAPSWGGLWEAAVKSVKRHISRTMRDQRFTFEEYHTLLKQVEGWVNSRPLTPLTDDHTDTTALTPAHFLLAKPYTPLPEPGNLEEVPFNRLQRWNILQKLNQALWKRWQTEYLTTLIDRSKWTKLERNIQVNDLVTIKEDNLPPGKWLLGRVIKTLPSPADGNIRSATIRTMTGDYTRPILKLGLLIAADDDEFDKSIRAPTPHPKTNLSKLYDAMINK